MALETIKVLSQANRPFGSQRALAEAVAPRLQLYSSGWRLKGKALVTKTEQLLDHPDVTHMIRNWFEAATGFSVIAAMQKHVDWINGAVEHNGEALPPSYQALKDYEALTIPKPAKNVNVKQESLVARIDVRGEAPPIRARVLESLDVARETS